MSLMSLRLASLGRSPADASALLPRARVSCVVDAGQVLEIKVGVDLGGGDVGVPEQLLHAAKILTGFKQMRWRTSAGTGAGARAC